MTNLVSFECIKIPNTFSNTSPIIRKILALINSSDDNYKLLWKIISLWYLYLLLIQVLRLFLRKVCPMIIFLVSYFIR